MMLGGFGQGRDLSPEEQEMLLILKPSIEERANRAFETFIPLAVRS